MDENLTLRQKVNHVSCPGTMLQSPAYSGQTFPTIAAKYLEKTAPLEFCQTLSDHGDLLNLPSVGNCLQHYFPNVQVNISPAATGTADCECPPMANNCPTEFSSLI